MCSARKLLPTGLDLEHLKAVHEGYCDSLVLHVQQAADAEADLAANEEEGFATEDEESEAEEEASAADMEDLAGPFSRKQPQQIAAVTEPGKPKPMLTPVLRASLSKQGYKLIGQPARQALLIVSDVSHHIIAQIGSWHPVNSDRELDLVWKCPGRSGG